MGELLDLVRARGLTVVDYHEGDIPVSEMVREGESDRFQAELLDWDGMPVQAWRDENYEMLLEQSLGRAAAREVGAGAFKLRLTDLRGGVPEGETVTFTSGSPGLELSGLLLSDEHQADEFAEALFGQAAPVS